MTSGTHRSKKKEKEKEVRLCVRCTESILYAINTLPHENKDKHTNRLLKILLYIGGIYTFLYFISYFIFTYISV